MLQQAARLLLASGRLTATSGSGAHTRATACLNKLAAARQSLLLGTLGSAARRMHAAPCALSSTQSTAATSVDMNKEVKVDVSSLTRSEQEDLDWLSNPDFEDPQQFSTHYRQALEECGADELVVKVRGALRESVCVCA